jgi:hypothetical protein
MVAGFFIANQSGYDKVPAWLVPYFLFFSC